MAVPNPNTKIEDYYGYWQPYPTNTRPRRRLQQIEAIKSGGPFCAKVIAGFTIAYHIAYYTYQLAKVDPQKRRDLEYIIWLKQKYPFCASIGFPYKNKNTE